MKIKPITIYKWPLLIVAVAVTSGILAACAPVTSSTDPVGTATPTVKFVIPGEQNSGLGMTGEFWSPVSVNVTNFNLVEKLGEPNVPGEGHIHFFLDVDPPTESGKPAFTAEVTYADTPDTYFYWKDIGEGVHTFSAELVNNDHTPLDPPVIAQRTVDTNVFWDG